MAVRQVLDKNGKQRIDKDRGNLPIWQIDYYPVGAKGKRQRFNFAGREGVAQYLYLKLRAGRHHRIPLDAKIADLFPKWLDYCENNKSKRTYDDIITTLRVLVPFFGDIQVDALNQDIIEEYKKKRLSDKNLRRPGKVSKRTITKELSYLSSLITWAYETRKIRTHFKFKNFPRQDPPAKQVLSPEELHDFQQAVHKKHQLSIMLMSDSGLRVHEALTLRARQVDLANDLLLIRGKGQKERIVPIMSDRLRDKLVVRVLEIKNQQQEDPDLEDYLSVNPGTKKPYKDLRKTIVNAAKAAGISKHITTMFYGIPSAL